MKLKKFLCLFLLIAAVCALASCEVLLTGLGTTTTPETEEFEVKFDSKGGTDVASQKVKDGGYITEPKEPTREGYAFQGWYFGAKKWDFETGTVSRNMTLVARWKAVSNHVHEFSEATCTLPATCECGETVGTALGHSWVDATCTAPKTCSACGETEGKVADHTVVTIPAVDPTCTETGKSEGEKCSVCEKVITKQTVIAPLGHTEVIDNAEPAGCETTGLTEGKHCSVCSEVLVAQTVVPANGHTDVIDDAVPAGCETTGLTAGKHCSVCNTVIVAQTVVPATGHDWDDGVVTVSPSCTEEGVKLYTCNNDGTHTYTAPVAALGHTEVIDSAVPAGCETTGLTEGKHCSVCSEVLVAQTVVPANGHDWQNGECSVCHKQTSHKVYYYIGSELVYTQEFTEADGLDVLYTYALNGYDFLGWSDGIDDVTSIPAGTTEDVYLYGDIEAIEYTITYVVDGETTTSTYTISDSDIDLIDVPAKLGFNAYWIDSEGNTVTVIAAGTVGNITLTAKYEEVLFTITYELNGGKNDERNATEYSLADVPALYDPESRDGYLFEGWYLTADFSDSCITSLTDAPEGDIVLYAKWTAISGGTITPEAPL